MNDKNRKLRELMNGDAISSMYMSICLGRPSEGVLQCELFR